MLDNVPVVVEVKNKRLAVRPLNVNHSASFRRVFAEHHAPADLDFVFVIGDVSSAVDGTLEMPEKSFIFGMGKSDGKWTLADTEEVGELLDDLANVRM